MAPPCGVVWELRFHHPTPTHPGSLAAFLSLLLHGDGAPRLYTCFGDLEEKNYSTLNDLGTIGMGMRRNNLLLISQLINERGWEAFVLGKTESPRWAPTVCQALCLSFNPCNDIVIQGLQTRKRRPRDVNSFAQIIQWIGGRAVPKIWTLDTDPGQMSAGRQRSCWSQSAWSSYFVEQNTFPPIQDFPWVGGGRLVLILEESQHSGTPMYCDAKKLTWLF